MERQDDGSGGGGKIRIGVCVMEKKVSCSPMEQILERLHAFGEFELWAPSLSIPVHGNWLQCFFISISPPASQPDSPEHAKTISFLLANQPYDQAKALWRTAIDMDRIAAGLPCGSESFLLMFARWKKLEREFYNERKKRFDITQIPDIYDSCKYDLLHNSHLNLNGLHDLFKVTKLLADGVIPNEYGINPKQKLKIGSKIARRLLGKILIDLGQI